jgi:hypothetical protein
VHNPFASALWRNKAFVRVWSVATGLVQLGSTLAAGLLAALVGLRTTMWLAPLGALVAAWILWRSPVRQLRVLPEPRSSDLAFDPVAVALDAKREHPPGT